MNMSNEREITKRQVSTKPESYSAESNENDSGKPLLNHTNGQNLEHKKKFLSCFPLKKGNIILGYIVVAISLATITFHLCELGLNITDNYYQQNEKFRNFRNLDNIFGSTKEILERIIVYTYYLTYVIIAMLMLLFGVLFTYGAYKNNYGLVTTFFVYSFIHLFLTIILIVWEALTEDWIQLGLIVVADLLLIICLFSVKYLMEVTRTEKLRQGGEPSDKHNTSQTTDSAGEEGSKCR